MNSYSVFHQMQGPASIVSSRILLKESAIAMTRSNLSLFKFQVVTFAHSWSVSQEYTAYLLQEQ